MVAAAYLPATMLHRQPSSAHFAARLRFPILCLAWAVGAGHARSDDLPPGLLGGFTRSVQPLLLNKCATGACHGGPTAHEPRLRRPDVHGTIDRKSTLANLETFLSMLGPSRAPQPLVELLSVQHPRKPASRRLVMKPLTPAERVTLESWIEALRDTERHDSEQPVRLANHAEAEEQPTAAARPNRFRVLLDTGAPPLAARDGEWTGRTEIKPLLGKPRAAAIDVKPESVPPSPPRETDDFLPARPDAPASPPPTSKESR
jgi:hypothetical protein